MTIGHYHHHHNRFNVFFYESAGLTFPKMPLLQATRSCASSFQGRLLLCLLGAGAMVLARFSVDEGWYRAYILAVNVVDGSPSYDVIYIDYGNTETLTADR